MSFGADEEILQDFLVEAGEILEQLSEQLVELESRPDDANLLNAIFRGFHTVKGGAGFLQLHELVECCHIAENVFDILRKGERHVDSELMDVILEALDAVNGMFSEVRERAPITAATPELLAALARLAEPADTSVAPVAAPEPEVEAEPDVTDSEFEQLLNSLSAVKAEAEAPQAVAAPAVPTSEDITDAEFESLLDQLHGKGQFAPDAVAPAAESAAPAASATSTSATDITDDEFEALLDQLHGKGTFAAEALPEVAAIAAAPAASAAPASVEPATDGLISDHEFEALLDELHGKGKFSEVAPAAAATATPVAAKPAPAKAAAPVAAKPAPAPAAAPARAAAAPVAEKPASEAETTVRVDTARLDDIMNMVGELVLVRNRLVRLGLNSGDEAMQKAVSNLDVVTADLQTAVMKTRMQPIKKVFGRFPRLVRDLARQLKKEINLELVGEETDLDKNLVEALADPLVHLVRNAVDHGVETPEEREASGKSRNGKVILAAEQEGDHILLSITDDGKGMDPAILRNIAVKRGVMDKDAADRLTDTECYNLIFAPGFSTKTEISDVSGRGVGMDVVKTKISQLNGSINIYSTKGQGSKIVIKVPLTLAIMPTLMVMLGNQAFAFPLVNVNEIFHLDLSRTNVVDGQEVVIVRDKALPLFYLKRWLVASAKHEEQREGHVVILSVGTQRIGFVVDQLVGQEEVVIKPLGKMLQGTPGMSGATITGDGRIALILDVPSMLKRYAARRI
ncbi:chemotaxis protein CheA [Pseudomonas sp. WS 5532]|uniref:chemotaxis protein CheA n=1 Tax=unclassified Pseudomonas TaxID=196821 RepID=UPI00147653A2|nr:MULTISPECIES: chemotaxis protein CheA [unclassified Pseudomonas]NMX77059.1 chemotaxis protein CheA [Pseudomonas sp. WS 5532]QXI57661.1 chemotaxis protein CheA [Pseudomonas sp. OE 28.3]